MKFVLTFSVGPFPLSLATVDGNPTKTVKPNLMYVLDEKSPECVNHRLQINGAIMVDALVLLQSLTRIPKTFGELSSHILSLLFSLAAFYKASRTDFVADQYPERSIKNSEISRRPSHGRTFITIYERINRLPHNRKSFLAVEKTKKP